ncbi:MAG: hypothetical protein HQL44_03180 [Alphaproteobacteria bacterium]|nr:hypothetical protein [Alphaproteobacteria bacterium]
MSDALVRSKSLLDNTLMEILVFLLFISYVAYSNDDKSVRAIPVTGPLKPSCLVRDNTTYEPVPLVEIEAVEKGLLIKKINLPPSGGGYQSHPLFKDIPTNIALREGDFITPDLAKKIAVLAENTSLNISDPKVSSPATPTQCAFYSRIFKEENSSKKDKPDSKKDMSDQERFLLQHFETLKQIDEALPFTSPHMKDDAVVTALIKFIQSADDGTTACLQLRDNKEGIGWVGTAEYAPKEKSMWRLKPEKIDLKQWAVNPKLMTGEITIENSVINLSELPAYLHRVGLKECVLHVEFVPKLSTVLKSSPEIALNVLAARYNIGIQDPNNQDFPRFKPTSQGIKAKPPRDNKAKSKNAQTSDKSKQSKG